MWIEKGFGLDSIKCERNQTDFGLEMGWLLYGEIAVRCLFGNVLSKILNAHITF